MSASTKKRLAKVALVIEKLAQIRRASDLTMDLSAPEQSQVQKPKRPTMDLQSMQLSSMANKAVALTDAIIKESKGDTGKLKVLKKLLAEMSQELESTL